MSDGVELDILWKLRDLHKQATVERSHFYVGSVVFGAIAEILRLQRMLKHFGELSEADHNQLRERAEHLCLVIRTAKDELESHDEAGAYLTLKNSGVGDVE